MTKFFFLIQEAKILKHLKQDPKKRANQGRKRKQVWLYILPTTNVKSQVLNFLQLNFLNSPNNVWQFNITIRFMTRPAEIISYKGIQCFDFANKK